MVEGRPGAAARNEKAQPVRKAVIFVRADLILEPCINRNEGGTTEAQPFVL